MRILTFPVLAIAMVLSVSAHAQNIPAVEVNKPDTAATAKKGIPLDGLWRSDSALIEAEKLAKEQKYAASLSLLDQIIARNPRNSDAYVDQALAWLNLGHTDKAKLSIENALLADKNHMGAYVVSGLIAMIQKDTQQAEYALQAIRILCRGESCPEFQTLQRILRETRPAVE